MWWAIALPSRSRQHGQLRVVGQQPGWVLIVGFLLRRLAAGGGPTGLDVVRSVRPVGTQSFEAPPRSARGHGALSWGHIVVSARSSQHHLAASSSAPVDVTARAYHHRVGRPGQILMSCVTTFRVLFGHEPHATKLMQAHKRGW